MVLCLLMMFDAAVVIAEILLDLHAMRSKSLPPTLPSLPSPSIGPQPGRCVCHASKAQYTPPTRHDSTRQLRRVGVGGV